MLEQEGIRGVPLDVDRWLHENPLHCAFLHSTLLYCAAMCSPAQQPAALRLLHTIGLHSVMPYGTLMHPTVYIAPLHCASLHGAPLQRAAKSTPMLQCLHCLSPAQHLYTPVPSTEPRDDALTQCPTAQSIPTLHSLASH